jgi:GntR family transcriptional repressor for pyruvate dehydrogenase complex
MTGDGLFTRVGHGKMAGEVVQQVETLVLEGVLRPGDRLPAERDLARMLDVSRPTLRQALAELEQEGLLEARQGGGTFIAPVMRSVFAEPIIGLFAERATAADKEILSQVVETMHAAHGRGDASEEARLDVEFHIAIVDATHNIVLIQTLRSIYNLLVHGVFYNRSALYRLDGGRERLMAQHEAIYDAIMAADGAAAAAAIHAHLDYVRQAMHDVESLGVREATALRRLRKFEQTETTYGKARRRKTS